MNPIQLYFRSLLHDAMDWCKDRSAIIRIPFLLYLGYTGIQYVRNDLHNSWFSGLILGVHELGHFLFSGLGQFMTAAGGSLTQLIVPIIGVGMFLYQRDYFGLAVAGCWESYSMYELATYIGDAQALQLPLVSPGGGDTYHDWEWILVQLDLIEHDAKIAAFTRCIAFTVLLISWSWGAWVCYRMVRPATEFTDSVPAKEQKSHGARLS